MSYETNKDCLGPLKRTVLMIRGLNISSKAMKLSGTCNTEAGSVPWVPAQTDLQLVQTSPGCRVRPCPENKKKQKTKQLSSIKRQSQQVLEPQKNLSTHRATAAELVCLSRDPKTENSHPIVRNPQYNTCPKDMLQSMSELPY